MFRDARTSTGARKRLLKLQRVTDNDGAIDEVWHFTHGRAYDLAAAYFDCDPVNGSWAGLPLMGLPEQGPRIPGGRWTESQTGGSHRHVPEGNDGRNQAGGSGSFPRQRMVRCGRCRLSCKVL